jgi:hypothetical protein
VSKPPNVNASDTRKYHIINFPQPTLNGDFPPLKALVELATVAFDILIVNFNKLKE